MEKAMYKIDSMEKAIDTGLKIARHAFAKRGNNSEIHINESDLAAYLTLAYVRGQQEAEAARAVCVETVRDLINAAKRENNG